MSENVATLKARLVAAQHELETAQTDTVNIQQEVQCILISVEQERQQEAIERQNKFDIDLAEEAISRIILFASAYTREHKNNYWETLIKECTIQSNPVQTIKNLFKTQLKSRKYLCGESPQLILYARAPCCSEKILETICRAACVFGISHHYYSDALFKNPQRCHTKSDILDGENIFWQNFLKKLDEYHVIQTEFYDLNRKIRYLKQDRNWLIDHWHKDKTTVSSFEDRVIDFQFQIDELKNKCSTLEELAVNMSFVPWV